METTSREAFCFRPHPDRGRGHSHTQPRQTRRGVSGIEDKRQQRGDHPTPPAGSSQQEAAEMRSRYQEDFPPPPSGCRRLTPAFPQPDNLGINPAFRLEFSTAQRDSFPGWPAVEPSRPGRIRATEPEARSTRLQVKPR
ncbi:uncharacterized protein si:dkeyp-69c1.9 [Kryptolebias marmoratus]|uniref:uncharacterized protein si:dkeyp-69c1.9 n=1 Tax=Kryptolebias marmoratus TaxID=37003 RepID=UPI0018ACED53|nr:uncharacterized protein si:dkeyp-69c1.9 [Kryptolebias marmoratus]